MTDPKTVAGVTLPVLVVALLAVGHVGALLVIASPPPLATVALFESVLLGAVALLTIFDDGFGSTLGVTVLSYVAATALAWLAVSTGSLLAVTLLTVLALVLVGYGIHRYELVALGLVEPADE
ncbi:hypothetical protein [Haloarcula marina]|uniref:hypothetical protein n=1 Tax=Haloarcula marina TaxID=2961574 RepID=UPI0020B8B3B5|nr:hypothetical protein [Halomicroarcula marina]